MFAGFSDSSQKILVFYFSLFFNLGEKKPLIDPYEFMNVIRNVRMVTYSLLPLTLTTKEFGVISVCLNCKAINKQVIVFSRAKKGKVWLVGKLLPM